MLVSSAKSVHFERRMLTTSSLQQQTSFRSKEYIPDPTFAMQKPRETRNILDLALSKAYHRLVCVPYIISTFCNVKSTWLLHDCVCYCPNYTSEWLIITSRNLFTNGLMNNFVISFPCPRIHCTAVNHELMKPWPHDTSVPSKLLYLCKANGGDLCETDDNKPSHSSFTNATASTSL